jgi:hypothetical protein
MKLQNIVYEILKIPETLNKLHNLSVYQLLVSSGYFENYELITELNISQELYKDNSFVDFWFDLSDSKRTFSGWHISRDKDKYTIAFYPSEENNLTYEFENSIDACARFIKLEIEEIRTSK